MKTIVAVTLAALMLAGCNTIEGVGQDIQGAGKAVERGAKKVKRAVTD